MTILVLLLFTLTLKAPTVNRLGLVVPIAADVIVVIVTWVTTVRQVRQASSLGMNMGYSGIVLRDGTSLDSYL